MNDDYDPFEPSTAREDVARDKFVTRLQQKEDIKRLMSQKWGRRLMWSWLEFCGVRRTAMTGNSQTYFLLGQQNVGLMLEAGIMEHAPESWVEMVNEAREARLRDGAHSGSE